MIYIDIKMPNNCAECPVLYIAKNKDCFQCLIDRRFMYEEDKVWMTETRPNWCPLKEVNKDGNVMQI